jgi:hypothetical protein
LRGLKSAAGSTQIPLLTIPCEENALLDDSGTSSKIPSEHHNALDVDLVIASRGIVVAWVKQCRSSSWDEGKKLYNGEFDPGSERTLAAWIRHASRTRKRLTG